MFRARKRSAGWPVTIFWFLPVVCLICACQSSSRTSPSAPRGAQPLTIRELQERAARFHEVLTVPVFETTVPEIQESLKEAIRDGNTALDRIAKLPASKLNFANTFAAIDNVNYEATAVASRFAVMRDTNTNAAVRAAANEAGKAIAAWSIGTDYRDDVYQALNRVAAAHPSLLGEDKRLIEETLRDFRRVGMSLPPGSRKRIEAMRQELSGLVADFSKNITDTKQEIVLTRAELEGVPSFLLDEKDIRHHDDRYTLQVAESWQYSMVMENARKEETREKMETASYNVAREKNLPLIRRIVELRNSLALELGYPSWSDYAIEVNMAGSASNAVAFVLRLRDGLQPRLERELAALQKLKAAETHDPKAVIHDWDWRYYSRLQEETNRLADAGDLGAYFPYDKTLQGMFAVYERIFGIVIRPARPPAKWVDDLALYAALDAATGEPLGLFYLDMFPREGKYNYFQETPILEGKQLSDGRYQRPVACLICNFPAPSGRQASLLSHDEVETLFHEFGHTMHSMLTRAKYGRFSGTSVPQDFVEAPSQMLENWVWDQRVLDTFAVHYEHPGQKIPPSLLKKVKISHSATLGAYYRRQLAFALLDLGIHGPRRPGEAFDVVKVSNEALGRAFLPPPPDTAFIASFGHLADYDAGYYGYAWADAIAADMATVFENAPDGYLDTMAGRRLRDEVYSRGASRDVSESIEKFLGRPWSVEPFLKKIGVKP